MDINVDTLPGGITRITLTGRMDFAGASAVDAQFMACANSAQSLLVDLSKVTFLASMGIRTLMTAAKALKQRGGGKMILFAPELSVAKVLTTSGTDIILPVYYDLGLACSALAPTQA